MNLREEGTNDEINDVMLMRKPEPTIISANLDEKHEHSGEAEAKRINAKYGVLPNDQCLTVFGDGLVQKMPKCSHRCFHMANEVLIQALSLYTTLLHTHLLMPIATPLPNLLPTSSLEIHLPPSSLSITSNCP